MVDRDGYFEVRKLPWPLYQNGNILTTQSSGREGLNSNVSLRWRLMVTVWWLMTESVELATLRKVPTLAGGRRLEGRVTRYSFRFEHIHLLFVRHRDEKEHARRLGDWL